MEDLVQIMRREASNLLSERQWKGTLVVTGWNKDTHAVKGVLVPQEVETGWIPLSVLHAGKGFGIGVGPNVGTKEKLEGDVFDVEFENGDPNTPVAKMKHHSAEDTPPPVESGEILVKHQKGGSTFFDKEGGITTTHKDGGTIKFDKDGNLSADSKDKKLTLTSQAGHLA